MYTDDDIFRIVKKRAETLEKSFVLNTFHNKCLYRHPNGLKCFIGELIPDEMYEPEMENKGIDMLWEYYPEIFSNLFKKDQIPFLEKLQQIHDSCPIKFWKEEIENLEQSVKTYNSLLD
jgi:hypothetical protein